MSPHVKGMLYLAAGIATAVVVDSLLVARLPGAEEFMVPLSGLTTIAIDLLDRRQAADPLGWTRFVSPECGGTLKHIPIWLWASLIVVLGVGAIIARAT